MVKGVEEERGRGREREREREYGQLYKTVAIIL